ncbi:MAG: ornithine aminomutase subunit alpha [Tissierellaceae bacterium]|nr:ornithine aminomutase subunit alpha [Tissierellaceae bacterium]
MERKDDFNIRRKHLANLSEEELEIRFWELAEKIVDPIVEFSRNHTSPSIERSILLRMGFSSLEAKSIVEGAIDRGLIGKGAGHLVYRLAREKHISIREAGLKLVENEMWEDVISLFKGGSTYEAKA